jgi:glyoxylase-like metal-dependent hydrolase (beta-lactamase superfamily II)
MAPVPPLHPGPTRFEGGLTEVGPGVHAWLQPNGLLGESNAGLVIGEGASLLVDTLWDRWLTRRMLAAMAPLVRDAPIELPVNTRSDGDHWWGNQEVRGAEIIATESARAVREGESPAEMKRFGVLAAALRLAGSTPFPYPRRGEVAAIAADILFIGVSPIMWAGPLER